LILFKHYKELNYIYTKYQSIMFFVDKYAPTSIEDSFFHKDILKELKIMSEDEAVPHIIFYGPPGSGKKTAIKLFLEMLYDKDVHVLTKCNYIISGSGNSNKVEPIKQSNYHIVIDPKNNNFDRYVIQNVVRKYAERKSLNVFLPHKSFKTVLINNLDNLSYYAQTSLRRTMEQYSGSCRFIMWCRSLSKVIDPLRSRCYMLRIKSPKDPEILKLLLTIAAKENIKLELSEYDKILEKANGDIKEALWLLQLHDFGYDIADDNLLTYDKILNEMIDLITQAKIENIFQIREIIYKIMITNISGTQIIIDVVNKLLLDPKVPDKCKYNIVEFGAKYEHTLIIGRREIIHLDTFIINVLNELHLNK